MARTASHLIADKQSLSAGHSDGRRVEPKQKSIAGALSNSADAVKPSNPKMAVTKLYRLYMWSDLHIHEAACKIM